MPQEDNYRFQKAVLWTFAGYDGHGEVKVNAAAEIDVRWEERRSETLDADGNSIAVDATVVLGQEVAVGSILWLGALADVATPPVNLKQVVVCNSVPDVKAREFRRTVGLAKYSNELPTLA